MLRSYPANKVAVRKSLLDVNGAFLCIFASTKTHPFAHIKKHHPQPRRTLGYKNRRVPNTRLFLSLVGATMSKFTKYQTQANCHECPAGLLYFAPNRGKDSNPTKGFCRLNPQFHQNKQKNRINCGIFVYLWSGRKDSNLRHLGPKPSTLPD